MLLTAIRHGSPGDASRQSGASLIDAVTSTAGHADDSRTSNPAHTVRIAARTIPPLSGRWFAMILHSSEPRSRRPTDGNPTVMAALVFRLP